MVAYIPEQAVYYQCKGKHGVTPLRYIKRQTWDTGNYRV